MVITDTRIRKRDDHAPHEDRSRSVAVALAGGAALATATTAQAATGPADDSVRAVGVHAAAEETPINARGSITGSPS